MGMGKRNKATSSPKALLELPSNLQLPPAGSDPWGQNHASSSNAEHVKCGSYITDEKAQLVLFLGLVSCCD